MRQEGHYFSIIGLHFGAHFFMRVSLRPKTKWHRGGEQRYRLRHKQPRLVSQKTSLKPWIIRLVWGISGCGRVCTVTNQAVWTENGLQCNYRATRDLSMQRVFKGKSATQAPQLRQVTGGQLNVTKTVFMILWVVIIYSTVWNAYHFDTENLKLILYILVNQQWCKAIGY